MLERIALELVVEYFDNIKSIHSRENIVHAAVAIAKSQLNLVFRACVDYLWLGGNECLARAYYEVAERMYREIYIKYFQRGY